VTEFLEIVDHGGIVSRAGRRNGAPATGKAWRRLGAGDQRVSDFLKLWQDADEEVAVLKKQEPNPQNSTTTTAGFAGNSSTLPCSLRNLLLASIRKEDFSVTASAC
jgi:hypothetical protein